MYHEYLLSNESFYPNGIYKYPTGWWRNRFVKLFSGSISIVSYSPKFNFLSYHISIHLLKLNISLFVSNWFSIPSSFCLFYSVPLETMLFSVLFKILKWNWIFFFFLHVSISWRKWFFFFLIWFLETMKFFENWNDLIIRIQQSIQKIFLLFLLYISILTFSFLLITMYSLLNLL